MDSNENIYHSEEQESIDFNKLAGIFRRNWKWLLGFFLLAILSSYLYIRWTKPLYESYSEIKLDIEAEASEFGIGSFFEEKNLSKLSGEIELLKSRLFFRKVIDSMDLFVSYYTQGRLLSDEKYPESPFQITYKLKTNVYLDKPIYVEFINENHFRLSLGSEEFNSEGPVYTLGEAIENEDIIINLTLNAPVETLQREQYYFIIHSYDALLSYLETNFSVELQNLQANTIKLSFRDHNKYKARDLINSINKIYIDYTQQEKSLANKKKILWIDNQLEKIEGELSGYENYFEEFTITNRTSDLDEDLKQTLIQINAIDSNLMELDSRAELANDVMLSLEAKKMVTPLRIFPSDIQQAINDLNDVQIRREQVGLSYKETTFAVQELDHQLASASERLKGQLSTYKEILKEDKGDLQRKKRQLESTFTKMPGKNTEFKKNQRFYDLYEEFYLSLMQSKAEFEIAVAGITPNFKVLSPASYSSSPIYPKQLIVYGIGVIAGFVFSFMFVGIKYLTEDKVNTIEDVERILPFTVLGSVPKARKEPESRLIVDSNPKSGVSESLRSIRTNIQFLIPHKNSKVITVTSTVGGEGKTFISLNLGAILASSKKKVLVLDLDMRKPQIHASITGEQSSENGISTVLIDHVSWKDCLKSTTVSGLQYIPAGPIPPNPSELLLNGDFEKLLEEIKKDFDIIILDTPPVGLVTDGTLAMKRSDLTLLVTRAGYTRKKDLKNVLRSTKMNQSSKISLILNSISRSSIYGYNYGYYSDKEK